MSGIQRLTLISDPTNEFPKNANNSFKVRLPERLDLPGEGWHASLLSLTVPDLGQSNTVIATDAKTKVMTFKVTFMTRTFTSGTFRASVSTKEYSIELEDVMSAKQPVSSGVMFWQRAMQEVHNKIMEQLMYEQEQAKSNNGNANPLLYVNKNWMPQLSMKDGALILPAIPKGDLLNVGKTKAHTTLCLNQGIAEKFGFIEKAQGGGHVLGPNLQFTCPEITFKGQVKPATSVVGLDFLWQGDYYAGTQPSDLSSDVVDSMFLVNNNQLYLSRLVEWQFNNLDASFEKLVGTSKRTVMVYSDLVESSVVGSGKFPLLREVQLVKSGEGESTVEPLHHQWIKLRSNQMEMVEVEIASTAGPLTILPPGKTLVTIGLKQL